MCSLLAHLSHHSPLPFSCWGSVPHLGNTYLLRASLSITSCALLWPSSLKPEDGPPRLVLRGLSVSQRLSLSWGSGGREASGEGTRGGGKAANETCGEWGWGRGGQRVLQSENETSKWGKTWLFCSVPILYIILCISVTL